MRPTYHRTSVANRRRDGRRGGVLLVAMLTASALALCTLAGRDVRAATLMISGAGFGHGVGMSQEGALGDAQHGYDYRAILAQYYTGTTIGLAPAGQQVRLLLRGRVRSIPLERYVRGVVAAEMPASWPAAALQAQAVASRTYALTAHAGGSRFDVYADARSQVYRGKAAETPATNAAIAATAGQIVTYEGRPAITYFFASSGGRTEDVQNAFPGSTPEPWLRGVPDPFDGGSLHTWSTSLTFIAAAKRLRGLVRGSFRGIEVLRRGYSPRIISASVLGSKGATPVSGPTLAARFGLYDTWAYFSVASLRGVRPEPDRSGTQPPATPAPTAPAAAPSAPVTPGGGTSSGGDPTSGGIGAG